MITISIIIPTYNRVDQLTILLKQIHSQKNLIFKILVIVINDGSKDTTNEVLLNQFPNVIQIIGNANWWFTRCVNEGILKSISLGVDYVLILNDDSEIDSYYLSTLWQDFISIGIPAILGSISISLKPKGLVEFSGTKNFNFYTFRGKQYLPKLKYYENINGIYKTYTLNGRGTFIPLSIVNKIGLFDANLKQYGSDYEYVLRARRFKIPVYISWNAKVYNNLYMTSNGATFKKDNIINFLTSFFNEYSINSIKKNAYLYWKYGCKLLLPLYLFYVFIGTFKTYLFKYNNL